MTQQEQNRTIEEYTALFDEMRIKCMTQGGISLEELAELQPRTIEERRVAEKMKVEADADAAKESKDATACGKANQLLAMMIALNSYEYDQEDRIYVDKVLTDMHMLLCRFVDKSGEMAPVMREMMEASGFAA